jgi:hypothetical protein
MLAKKMLGAAVLLSLSAGLAAAAPATVKTNASVRQGPGTNYPVIATLRRGSVVDVEGCMRSWCQVDQGYVARSVLALAGTPPAVAVAPGYGEGYPGYDEGYGGPSYFSDYDYPGYGYGYGYGPGVGVYVPPRGRHGHFGRHRPGGPGWAGNPPRGPGWAGNPQAPGGVSPGVKPRAAFGQVGRPGGFAGGAPGGFRGGAGGGFAGGAGAGGGGTVGSAPAAAAPAGGGGMSKK